MKLLQDNKSIPGDKQHKEDRGPILEPLLTRKQLTVSPRRLGGKHPEGSVENLCLNLYKIGLDKIPKLSYKYSVYGG